MDETGGMVRARVMRLLHTPPLALLLGLGLAPFFILFPDLPAPELGRSTKALELWIGVAVICGLAGAVDGVARPLYRIGGVILAASLLSLFAMCLLLQAGVPFPHVLSGLLGLDGEASMDAALYEVWIMGWLTSLAAVLLGLHALRRPRRIAG